jgi:hypothetical protein
MKTYKGVDKEISSFVEGYFSASRPGRFTQDDVARGIH